jgi:hypothetical protein
MKNGRWSAGLPNNHLQQVRIDWDAFPYVLSFQTLVPAEYTGYITDEKKEPILPPGMKEHLKADLNRTIDDF